MPVAVVTGANRGIGLELCKELLARGFDVIGASRRASPELEQLGVRVEELDVADTGSVESLSRRLSGDSRIDLLVNNAGQYIRDSLEHLDGEGIQRQVEVNAIGPLRVTRALLPLMNDGAKVAMITSRMGSIGDNTSGGSYGYRMSKAALNAGSVSMAHDLRGRGVAVVILHPGFVKTDMTGGQGDVTPDVSAKRLVDRMEELTMENTGRFLHASGEELPW